MASVQDRLQLKRPAGDKWSIREQLCLASAVACSGDQNWMSVSRSLKMLCGNNRSNDWFSQKSCAVQYGELLENVETPKRKKRSISERDNSGSIAGNENNTSSTNSSNISSSSNNIIIAETPTESILRKLTQERISELRALIQREQEEYVKLREEILYIQNGSPTEAELKEMLTQIETEKEQKNLEQQKYAQWVKEREECKSELQKCWKPGTSQQAQQSSVPVTSTAGQLQQQQQQQGKPLQLNLNLKSEDMEIEDSNSSSKAGTSPLLTSLLKSPSPAPSSSSSTAMTPISNVRATAPTITNLLTGNAQIQQISTPPSTSQYNPVQNQPLTGPIPVHPQLQTLPTTPSKSAPTLSMLLENKNKENITASTTTITESVSNPIKDDIKDEQIDSQQEAIESQDGDDPTNKDEDQQLMEVFNGLIPDNIEELADILTNNNAIILNPELLEEESILENVESLIDEQEEEHNKEDLKNDENIIKPEKDIEGNEENQSLTTAEIKEETKSIEDTGEIAEVKNEPKTENDVNVDKKEDVENVIKEDIKIEIDIEEETMKSLDIKNENTEVEVNLKEEKTEDKMKDYKEIEGKDEKSRNSEISDDSSDNTTLQMLKEKISTTVENKISVTRNDESSSSELLKNTIDDKKQEVNISEKEEINKEASSSTNVDKFKENQEILSPKSKDVISEMTIEIIEEKDMEKNKESSINQEESSKSEIVENNNEICDTVEEQKKSPSESSVIVIQEDDDSNMERVTSNEQESNQNEDLQKNSMEISVLDIQRIDDELLGIQDEKQILKSLEEEIQNLKSHADKPTVIDQETKDKSQNENRNDNNNPTMAGTSETTGMIVIDTDEESTVDIIKDDTVPRMKRDYSRKKLDNSVSNANASCTVTSTASNVTITMTTVTEKKSEERSGDESTTVSRQNLSIKRLKEREGSESPLVDDETTDSIPRTRRRYSSTPIFDSIPNSPASSDDKEYKAWKKSILMIYNRLTIHKNASIFLRPVTEDVAPNYKQIVHKPMDLQTIKKNIENGVIRTTAEFQRDVMLMCQNAIMYNQTNNNVYNMAKEMWADSVNVIETLLESVKKDASDRLSNTNTANIKSRGRKSNRLP